MARLEDLFAAPAQWYVVASAVNGAAIANFPAAVRKRHYLVGVDISASDAPAAPVSATLQDGGNLMTQLEIPVGKFAPIMHNYQRPWVGSENAAMTLTLPALGAGVRGTVTIRGFTAMA